MATIDSKETALDCAIRDSEISSNSDYGYIIDGKKPYENYMSNETWKVFLNQMSDLHRHQFDDGDGGELKEKNNLPPKMASYGSSSRFIYQCSNIIPDFCFEMKLPTKVGGPANLDGFLSNEDIDIYVEAKCREIYGHTKQEISIAYKKVFDCISEMHAEFSYDESSCNDARHFLCAFKYNNKEIVHFDIKQLICHFLGITADILENKQTKKIRFVYLIFNPNSIEDKIDKKHKDAILSIYKDTIEEIKSMGDMCWLFNAVLEFQTKNLNLKLEKVPTFEFIMADQNNYRNAIDGKG